MSELILIIDRDRDLVRTLKHNLGHSGYLTRWARSGREGVLQAALEPIPDLILLEPMLPDVAGVEVCRQIRQGVRTRAIPVLMLTAKNAETDRVLGFEVGADDYVVKPFSDRELMLRIRAILRRTNGHWKRDHTVRSGPFEVDMQGHWAKVDGVHVNLTPMEFQLLTAFLVDDGKAWSRAALLSKVWNINKDLQTRTVDVHVKRLREKLGESGRYIETVRGVGYRLCTALEQQDSVARESAFG